MNGRTNPNTVSYLLIIYFLIHISANNSKYIKTAKVNQTMLSRLSKKKKQCYLNQARVLTIIHAVNSNNDM